MSSEDLFISGTDLDRGNLTVHAYDREKPDGRMKKDGWFRSLCGQSTRKESNARSFRANRGEVNCGTCLRILDSRRDDAGTLQGSLRDEERTDGGRDPIARIPLTVWNRPAEENPRGPTGKFATVSTREAEFYDRELGETPLGLLPRGFADVGTLSGPITAAFERAGYDAEEFDVEEGGRETVAFALVYEDPRDVEDVEADEWIEFEEEP